MGARLKCASGAWHRAQAAGKIAVARLSTTPPRRESRRACALARHGEEAPGAGFSRLWRGSGWLLKVHLVLGLGRYSWSKKQLSIDVQLPQSIRVALPVRQITWVTASNDFELDFQVQRISLYSMFQ